MTKTCETICDDCPFRRDSTPMVQREGWPDSAAWLGRHGWPLFEAPECPVEGAACLGWAVHLANVSAACMVPSTLAEWVEEWAKDEDLIFGGNSEFIRYHRGEWFGSVAYREDWKSRIERPATSYEFNESGQGSLF